MATVGGFQETRTPTRQTPDTSNLRGSSSGVSRDLQGDTAQRMADNIRAANNPGGSDRDPDRGGKSADKDKPAAEQFEAFGITGIDTSSMLADIQTKYGALAGETGRRGAQAREILAQQGDNAARDFLGTDAYARLQEDPTSISDASVSAALTAAIGTEWVALAEGQKGDQGTINATNIDFESLDALLKMKGTPFSFLSDVQQAATPTATQNAVNNGEDGALDEAAESIIPQRQTLPTPPGSPVSSTAGYFPTEEKRV